MLTDPGLYASPKNKSGECFFPVVPQKNYGSLVYNVLDNVSELMKCAYHEMLYLTLRL